MDVFLNGSRWLKADFHLHTRSDAEFKYQEREGGLFIDDYINKLLETEVSIGLITNHNKFAKEEFKALKKKAFECGIGLFAGVELSLKEGIHILIGFDDAWYQGPENQIQSFLNSAFYNVPNPISPPYPNSCFDLKKAVEALDEIGHNYFICLAHVDDQNGLFKVLNRRTLEQFIQQEAFGSVIAVQKSGNLQKYNRLCELAGRSIACVEGTDDAHHGIRAIGNGRVMYLKVGDYNFEAVKYALLDHNNRVRAKDCPRIENSYIKSIVFEGGLLDGTSIDFSPELNTLIGIRGSGKSSILEVLRYSLGIKLGGQAVDSSYKQELIPYVLKSGGKVSVTVVTENNEEYRIDRIYGQKEDIYKNGQRVDATINAFFKQPVYFGQKDLSNKDIDFKADLINKLVGTHLKGVRENVEACGAALTEAIHVYKKLDNLSELKSETEGRIKDAQHTLKLYKEKGVAEKLKRQAKFDSDVEAGNDTYNQMLELYNQLIELIEDSSTLFDETPTPEGKDSKTYFDKIVDIFGKIKAEFNKIELSTNNMGTLIDKLEKVVDKLSGKQEELKEEFAKIKREINIANLDPDEFLKLNKQVQTDKAKLAEIGKKVQKRKALAGRILTKAVELDNLWHKEFQTLQEEVKKINESESELSIEITYKGRKDRFLAKTKEICRGSGIRNTAYGSIVNAYADFIQIYRDPKALRKILNNTQYIEFWKRLNDNLADLLSYQVENRIVIKYKNKPLAKHSLGERASALILFLLAQRDCDVLIIDQPEDDLDSQTIYKDVIRKLKSLKGNMQFVFATHNANIPVLGDSEKVIACDCLESRITIDSGNVDKPATQRKVVDVMEGGKEAFEHRKRVYGLWKID